MVVIRCIYPLGKIFLFTGYRILFDKMQSISMCFVNFVNFVNF